MKEYTIIGIDPSTTNIGVAGIVNGNSGFAFSKEPRVHKKGKKGQELKATEFDVNTLTDFYYDVLQAVKRAGGNIEAPMSIILPKMGGSLNYTTIDRLSKLCGLIHGSFLGTNFNVWYLSEATARAQVLKKYKNKDNTYKECALKLCKDNGYDISNDDEADALVLALATKKILESGDYGKIKQF